jgi:hypothetical protein
LNHAAPPDRSATKLSAPPQRALQEDGAPAEIDAASRASQTDGSMVTRGESPEAQLHLAQRGHHVRRNISGGDGGARARRSTRAGCVANC